jgi:hypothetical protein
MGLSRASCVIGGGSAQLVKCLMLGSWIRSRAFGVIGGGATQLVILLSRWLVVGCDRAQVEGGSGEDGQRPLQAGTGGPIIPFQVGDTGACGGRSSSVCLSTYPAPSHRPVCLPAQGQGVYLPACLSCPSKRRVCLSVCLSVCPARPNGASVPSPTRQSRRLSDEMSVCVSWHMRAPLSRHVKRASPVWSVAVTMSPTRRSSRAWASYTWTSSSTACAESSTSPARSAPRRSVERPIGYCWSYLAFRIGHLVPIWQPCWLVAFSLSMSSSQGAWLPVSPRAQSRWSPVL